MQTTKTTSRGQLNSVYCYAYEMLLILQNVIAFLLYTHIIPEGTVQSHLGQRNENANDSFFALWVTFAWPEWVICIM